MQACEYNAKCLLKQETIYENMMKFDHQQHDDRASNFTGRTFVLVEWHVGKTSTGH